MKKIFWISLCVALAAISFTDNSQKTFEAETPVVDSTVALERHNFYRAKVGAPNIKWSNELAMYAQKWANKLAATCALQHSAGKYGENIYWTSGTATTAQVIDYWAEEEKYFNHNNPVYQKGKSAKSGHYSQVIWAKSTHVGMGVANCKNGGQIWVASYDPHGNVIGQKAY